MFFSLCAFSGVFLVVAWGFYWLASKAPKVAYLLAPIATAVGVGYQASGSEGQLFAVVFAFWWPWALYASLMHRSRNGLSRRARGWFRGTLWLVGFLYVSALPFAMSGLGVIFPLMYVGIFLRSLRRLQESRAMELIALLRSCVRQQLPLVSVLERAADEQEEDGLQEIFSRLATELKQGRPLVEGLTRAWRRCPGHLLATLQAGERTSQLPAALERLYEDLRRTRWKTEQPFYGTYILAMLFLLSASLIVSMTWVLPTLQKIYAAHGAGLPSLTQALIRGVEFLWKTPWVLLLVGGLLLLLLLGFRPFFFFRKETLLGSLFWLDGFRWWMPGWGRFERDISMLQLIEVLRFGVRAGCPLPALLKSAEELDVNALFRRKIKHWRGLCERGEEAAASARQAGLGEGIAWAFEGPSSHTEDALGALESLYRTNLSHRSKLIQAMMFPALQLCFGLLVGFILLALLLPIFHLADQVRFPAL